MVASLPGRGWAGPGERFRPSASPNSHLTTETSQVVPAWTPAASILIPYGQSVHPSSRGDIAVDRRTATHVLAALGLANWAELGFDLPLIVNQTARREAGQLTAPAPISAVGDLRLGAKGTILRTPRRGLGAGLAFDVTAPTGDPSAFAGWGKVSYLPQLLIEHRTAMNILVGANLGYWARPEIHQAGESFGDAITYRAAVRVPLPTLAQLSAVAEMDGNIAVTKGARHPLSLLAGLRYQLRSGVILSAYGGGAPIQAIGVPAVQAIASVQYAPPKMLRTERAFVRSQRPGAVAWARRRDSLRAPIERAEPTEGRDPKDRDGDEILVMLDKCPGVAEDRDGFEDADGCPELDNDRDSLRDEIDLCRDAPELINGYLDQDGCPDRRLAQGGETFTVFDPRRVLPIVAFDETTGLLTEGSIQDLDSLAELLRLNPWMQSVHLTVYVARSDDARRDQDLATERSSTITSHLVARGVERWRIYAAPARAVPEGTSPRVRLTLSSPPASLSPLAPNEDALRRIASQVAAEHDAPAPVEREGGRRSPVLEAQGPQAPRPSGADGSPRPSGADGAPRPSGADGAPRPSGADGDSPARGLTGRETPTPRRAAAPFDHPEPKR